MGRTANIIIKDIIHIFASMCKNMRILVMGRRYRERCNIFVTVTAIGVDDNRWELKQDRQEVNTWSPDQNGWHFKNKTGAK